MGEGLVIWVVLAAVVALGILVFVFMKMLQTAQAQMLELARTQFEAAKSKVDAESDLRNQSVAHAVESLNAQLDKYQALLRQAEEDRMRKFGHIESEIKNASMATLRLQESTNRLNNILGNVKLRGQWGERMAEDIIRHAGLIEGVNYTKQEVNSAQTKPDFTFLLPNGHKINMDVKFPLDNYLLMVNEQNVQLQEGHQKEFIRNVKDRIKEVQNRDYINPQENTLDFMLLFIPNEQVYGLIQEKIPELMDLALKQKVVLCSPFTLYAMLSVVRQAFENFRYEKDLKQIIGLVDQFTKLYAGLKVRFDAMGDAIQKADLQYKDIVDKNFKQLDTKIRHIEEYKKGSAPETTAENAHVIDISRA